MSAGPTSPPIPPSSSGSTATDVNPPKVSGADAKKDGGSSSNSSASSAAPPKSSSSAATAAASLEDTSPFAGLTASQLFAMGKDAVDKRLNSRTDEDKIVYAIKALERCRVAVKRSGVFSTNESLEDIKTRDFKFLLVDFFIGQLQGRIYPLGDPAKREKQIRASMMYSSSFQRTCEKMDISVESSADASAASLAKNTGAMSVREMKIAQFQRTKRREKRLRELERHLAIIRKTTGEVAAAGGSEAVDDDCEELERERWLLTVQGALDQAANDERTYKQELQILQHMAKMKAVTAGPAADKKRDDRRRAPPPPGPGLSVTHVGPGMKITRETVKAQVFRQFHRAPTMTLAEFADREMAEATARSERTNEAEKNRVRRSKELHEEGMEDDEALADKATYKDRDWDDWCDDNPKGSARTKRF